MNTRDYGKVARLIATVSKDSTDRNVGEDVARKVCAQIFQAEDSTFDVAAFYLLVARASNDLDDLDDQIFHAASRHYDLVKDSR